jgi:hypothetical protein
MQLNHPKPLHFQQEDYNTELTYLRYHVAVINQFTYYIFKEPISKNRHIYFL